MPPDKRILKKCYYVKCPLFGEDGTIRPGQFSRYVFLLPNPDNTEIAAAELEEADRFFSTKPYSLGSHAVGAGNMLDPNNSEDQEKLTSIQREHPELIDEPPLVASNHPLASDLNPAIYGAWELKPEKVSFFEQMGFDQECAAIISPSSAEMHAYLDSLEKQYKTARQKWEELFGDVASVDCTDPDFFDSKMTDQEQYENPFLIDDGEKIWMLSAWEVANYLARSNEMYEAVKAVKENKKCPFTCELNERRL